MAKVEPMDILRDLTPTEHEVVKIVKWFADDKRDAKGYIHIKFKKDTPQKILDLYQKDYKLMYFKTKGDYTIEK